MNGFPKSIPVEVHRFPEEFLRENRLHAVNPQVFKVDDPKIAIEKGQPIDSAVQNAFDNALIYWSKVAASPLPTGYVEIFGMQRFPGSCCKVPA
jgi:hypothetical protein